jgi:hypothetical protein
MNASEPEYPTTAPGPSVEEGPIGRVESRLQRLEDAIRSAARRSRRISWMAWGSLFAAAVGVPLLGIGFTLARATSSPNVDVVIAVGELPAVVLFGLAVCGLILGRREAMRYPNEAPLPAQPSAPGAGSFGVSLLGVQASQQAISRVRGELEISMIPLILGGIALFELLGEAVVYTFLSAPTGPSTAQLVFLPVLPVVLVIPVIWVLWRVARQWVERYQRGLDDQVRQMISLEGEFLGRFASGLGGA